jgi:hypothetical protein
MHYFAKYMCHGKDVAESLKKKTLVNSAMYRNNMQTSGG